MRPPIVSVVGPDKKAKTAAVVALVEELTRLGYAVGTIKHHAHGDFDIDVPGKPSYRHLQAGARETAISGPTMFAYVRHHDSEIMLLDVARFFTDDIDVIVTEGYQQAETMKLEAPLPDVKNAAELVIAAFSLKPKTGG
jgi:molybdopterin-guanine dinucleotide biosynthesis protein B